MLIYSKMNHDHLSIPFIERKRRIYLSCANGEVINTANIAAAQIELKITITGNQTIIQTSKRQVTLIS